MPRAEGFNPPEIIKASIPAIVPEILDPLSGIKKKSIDFKQDPQLDSNGVPRADAPTPDALQPQRNNLRVFTYGGKEVGAVVVLSGANANDGANTDAPPKGGTTTS